MNLKSLAVGPLCRGLTTWFRLAAVFLVLLTPSLSRGSEQNADRALAEFFQKYLEATFPMRPLEATQLGDHRYDHLLDDISAAARAQWVVQARRTLRELGRDVDYSKLSRDGQIDFEILKSELEREIWLAENTKPFEEDPRVYNGYINNGVYLLLTQSTFPKETNIANAIARMAQIPSITASARQTLTHPPSVHTQTAIQQNRGAISFYEKDLFDLAGDTPQLERLKAAAAGVAACLKEYQAFLETDLKPRARGEWRLGTEKFSRKLELTLDAGLTADQVFSDAESEFKRVESELYVIARQLWGRFFPSRALPADDSDGRRQCVQAVLDAIAEDHCRPEELTEVIRKIVIQTKQFIAGKDLLRLPEPDRCQIIEMPEFQRGNSTAYMNSPPPLDPNAAGYYAVSPPPKDWDAQKIRSYLEEYNRMMLHILTIHEAYPGHYVQLDYGNRHPSLIRKVLGSGVFVEGWAVYTEQMMLDQGYGEGDLRLRLNQLKFYLRAVANAILDHKMHCTAMTDEQALEFLVQRCYQSEGEARLKVIRAKQSSTQLSTYFVGRMAHYRLRQQIQREMGDQFDLGRFHEAVLEPGAVPVKYLPELVRRRLKRPR